jgi:hypothetical protein
MLMSANTKGDRPAAVRGNRDHLEELLDQALADSFPASDPIAIDFEDAFAIAQDTQAGSPPSAVRRRSRSRCPS